MQYYNITYTLTIQYCVLRYKYIIISDPFSPSIVPTTITLPKRPSQYISHDTDSVLVADLARYDRCRGQLLATTSSRPTIRRSPIAQSKVFDGMTAIPEL